MPELPEVESARRLAQRTVVGGRIVGVATARDTIVYDGVSPGRFASALRGRRIRAACRHGKHLWFALDRRPWPCFHFGMTGRFCVYADAKERPPHWKVELRMADGTRLAMPDPRRFGRLRLRQNPATEPPIGDLGADPLDDLPGVGAVGNLLAGRRAPIKAVLLNQKLFAGVGNWIADEVLYQAGIAPQRVAAGLERAEVRRLRAALKKVIDRACAVDADSGRFPRTWLFHHRWGRDRAARTSRGERIIHETIGGRTTAWVPTAQG